MTTVNRQVRLEQLRENNEDAQRLIEIGNRQRAKYTEKVRLDERIESLRRRKLHLMYKKNAPKNVKEAVLESYTAQIKNLTEELSNKKEELDAISRELETFYAEMNAKKRQTEATPAPARVTPTHATPAVQEVGCFGASCGLWGGRKTRRHRKAKKAKKTKKTRSR